MEKHSTQSLHKSIGLYDGIIMVIGMVIGSGIFFKASSVFSSAGTGFWGIAAWIAGGLIAMASALTISEIATSIPKTGGIYAYLKVLYSERMAFLFGWVQSLLYVPGSLAALCVVFVTQATYFIPLSLVEQRLLAMGLIAFLVTINIISTKLGKDFQILATIGKLIPLAIIIALGLLKGTAGGIREVVSITPSATGFAGFGAAILGTLWAYDGWVGVTNIAGELKNPERNLPKAIVIGLTAIISVYLLFNVAMINIIPFEAITQSMTPATDAAIALFGNSGAGFIAIGIMISILGAANGYLMTGVRIPYAMSKDGLLPYSNRISHLTKKNQTPVYALLLEGCLACVYVLSGSFDLLTNLAMFMVWFFFIIAVAGIFKLRKHHKDLATDYKVPLYPVIPLIGILGGVYIIVSTFVSDMPTALVGIGITLSGLPIYSYLQHKN